MCVCYSLKATGILPKTLPFDDFFFLFALHKFSVINMQCYFLLVVEIFKVAKSTEKSSMNSHVSVILCQQFPL